MYTGTQLLVLVIDHQATPTPPTIATSKTLAPVLLWLGAEIILLHVIIIGTPHFAGSRGGTKQ